MVEGTHVAMETHDYFSVACHHSQHDQCPLVCRFCKVNCRCHCHFMDLTPRLQDVTDGLRRLANRHLPTLDEYEIDLIERAIQMLDGSG